MCSLASPLTSQSSSILTDQDSAFRANQTEDLESDQSGARGRDFSLYKSAPFGVGSTPSSRTNDRGVVSPGRSCLGPDWGILRDWDGAAAPGQAVAS